MTKKPTIIDIAKVLGVSTATVHRALHNHPSMTPTTKTRVLEMAKKMGYKPNLAARYLSSKRSLRISVNTLKGTTSFWDEVRTGIEDEKKSLDLENVEIEYRTYPQLGEGEVAAFEAALESKVDGIITFPSDPESVKPLMRRAAKSNVPVVFVATDAPGTGRISVVSIDTMASGSLAADLMGRLVQGKGTVAVTLFDADITEHAEKFDAFKSTMQSLYPAIRVHDPIEDHDLDEVAYEQCRKLIAGNPDLVGMYVTTENSTPVINAVRDAGLIGKLTIVTTDLFPALVKEIRSGTVTATIYQRPRTQGRMAFRVLHEFLIEGGDPAQNVTFAPHLVMRGNLEFFLQRVSVDSRPTKTRQSAGMVRKQTTKL
jgi:LacI family transcriptional regulator